MVSSIYIGVFKKAEDPLAARSLFNYEKEIVTSKNLAPVTACTILLSRLPAMIYKNEIKAPSHGIRYYIRA